MSQRDCTITPQDAIDYLNDIMSCDAEALERLIEHREPCNDALAFHPTVQSSGQEGAYKVGLLGILNGLFGVDSNDWGPIAAAYEVECPTCGTIGDKEGDPCPQCQTPMKADTLLRFQLSTIEWGGTFDPNK